MLTSENMAAVNSISDVKEQLLPRYQITDDNQY